MSSCLGLFLKLFFLNKKDKVNFQSKTLHEPITSRRPIFPGSVKNRLELIEKGCMKYQESDRSLKDAVLDLDHWKKNLWFDFEKGFAFCTIPKVRVK